MVMMIKAPEKIPAAPTPEIVRPTMKAGDVGATAETSDPSSKRNKAIMKVNLAGQYVYILP